MQQILRQFQFADSVVSCERYGNGHVNRTFHVVCKNGAEYILQRINQVAFQKPRELMENINAVTNFMSAGSSTLQTLHFIGTTDGNILSYDENGDCWRAYEFVGGGVCLDAPRNTRDFYEAAVAFGQFQMALSDFPAASLHETIPHFHDTCDRIRQLRESVEKDPLGRAGSVQQEIEFILCRQQELGELCRLLAAGELPLRVTHNDTKLNNVLLDETTGKARCVLDLDTVMPGLSAYDFGDAVRFGASTAAEDETDLSRVEVDLSMYEAFLRGYLDACGDVLTKREIEVLPLGAKIMTAEVGMRFLKDYIDGDIYFSIHRPGQNLDRARTQLKLVSDMEHKWDEMQRILRQVAGERL